MFEESKSNDLIFAFPSVAFPTLENPTVNRQGFGPPAVGDLVLSSCGHRREEFGGETWARGPALHSTGRWSSGVRLRRALAPGHPLTGKN